MNPPPPTADPVRLLDQLDPDALRGRLDQIDRERRALLVLLRAALRMGRPHPTADEEKTASSVSP
jgi:hypothetical protein